MNSMIPTWVGGDLVALDKLEAHQRGLLHKAVSVFVICGDDLLIQQRALGKYHTPGLWANTCCTHPNWGEAPEDCAQRRLQEELGISGLMLRHRDQVTYRADVGSGLIEHELVDIFVSRVTRRVTVVPNPDEVMETSWVNIDTLSRQTRETPDLFSPWLTIYLARHKDQIFAQSEDEMVAVPR